MKAFILAAGKGTRMGSLTTAVPKPLLPINGVPLLEITLRRLQASGFDDIAVNVHQHAGVMQRFFESCPAAKCCRILLEPELRGTAGALVPVADTWRDSSFLVMYGDVLTNVHYDRLWALHVQSEATATLLVQETHRPTEVGLVDFAADGRVTRFVEKPSPDAVFSKWCSAGVIVLSPRIFSFIPVDRASDLGRDVLPLLIQNGESVFAVPLGEGEYLRDIGSPSSYERGCLEWAHVR